MTSNKNIKLLSLYRSLITVFHERYNLLEIMGPCYNNRPVNDLLTSKKIVRYIRLFLFCKGRNDRNKKRISDP